MVQRPLVVVMVAMVGAAVVGSAQVVPVGDGLTGLRMDVAEGSVQRLVVTVGEVRLDGVEIDGLRWAVVQAPGASNTMERCLPSLPELATEVLLGDGDRIRLELESVREKAVDLTALGYAGVAPSKGHFTRDVDPETVPWCFDSKVYDEQRAWPGLEAAVDEPFIAGPLRGQGVRAPAARFEPATNRLLVVEEATYRVVRSSDVTNPRRRVAPPPNLALSYAAAERAVNGRAVVDGRLVEAGRAAFVVYDAFLDEVAPLVQWSELVGHPVVVAPLSSIPHAGASPTAAEVKTFLQGLYDQPAGLTWIVLVGDHEQIPTLRGGYENAHCDPCYAKLEGADHRLDAAVSRISAQSGAQVTVQVDKIVGYERYPDTGSAAAWYGGAFGIAGDDTGDTGFTDWERMDWLRVDLEAPAYNYSEFTQLYHSPSKAQVAAAVNAGRSLGLYIGHGSNTSWITSGFSVSDVNSMLSNQGMLPVIWDVACVNGAFHITSGDCFAEAWLKKAGGGAVSFEAATTNELWVPPCVAQRGIVDALRLETAFTTGGQHLAGKMHVQDHFGDGGSTEGTQFVEQSHLFGSAMMWTRTAPPAIPDEPLDGEVAGGVASLTVTVGGQPLAVAGSAIVSFLDRSGSSPVVVGSGLVDASGPVEAAVSGSPTHCHIHGRNLAPTEYVLAARPDGRLSLDAAAYACTGTVGLRVSDANVGAAEVTVSLAGPGGSAPVTLVEQPAESGFFFGAHTLGSAFPVSHGELLTASYVDADDGAGGAGVVKTATAVVDCQGPAITALTVASDHQSATVTFATDEPATTEVEYWTGTGAPQVAADPGLTTSHQIVVSGLEPCSRYFLRVASVDALGNRTAAEVVASDTDGWAVIAAESLDGDPGWARTGQWAWGTPAGANDPTAGHTGTTFFGYNHTSSSNGNYPNNMGREYLTTPDYDVSEASSLALRFWRKLGIESATWDHASVEASSDGGASWTVIWDHQGPDVTDSAWVEQVYDLSALLPAATIRVRWVMGATDTTVTYCGWNVDDVTLEGAVPCNHASLFADGFESGSCSAWSLEVGAGS